MARFSNQAPFQPHNLKDVLRWKFGRRAVPWPEWVENSPYQLPPRPDSMGALSVSFANHSSFLIYYHQLAILTDPIWSMRCSPVRWAGPRRVRNPGFSLPDLPELDVLLLSHNHYDHMDLPTLQQIALRHNPLVITGLGNRALLQGCGFARVHELDWWECLSVAGMSVHFVPAQHFSARSLSDRMQTLWGGFVIESPHGHAYFAGDTAWGPHFRQLRKRFQAFRLSLIPIGAYEPRWFMKGSHINPEEAVAAHLELYSRKSIAMHFGTFAGLTDEGMDQPSQDLAAALVARDLPPSSFVVPDFGQTMWIE